MGAKPFFIGHTFLIHGDTNQLLITMKKALILGSALCTLLFTNCKKKKDDPTPAKSKTELLTQHSWKLVSSTADTEVDLNDDDISSKDLMSEKADCEKDDIITFSSTGSPKTGSKDEGPTKCGSDQSTTFNWSFNDVESVIRIQALWLTVEEYTIEQLDENTLRVIYSAKDKNDKTYKGTDVYAKP